MDYRDLWLICGLNCEKIGQDGPHRYLQFLAPSLSPFAAFVSLDLFFEATRESVFWQATGTRPFHLACSSQTSVAPACHVSESDALCASSAPFICIHDSPGFCDRRGCQVHSQGALKTCTLIWTPRDFFKCSDGLERGMENG